ncbi:MAG: hypothetical protein DRN20_01945 [Thermoplasmata archaeon]|nr:MAG: hypothetical protein DRN20_01945 [Thermoplasmata archaeon]
MKMALYILPHHLRTHLAQPIGPVVRDVHEGIKKGLIGRERVVSVGDVCTVGLIKEGFVPDLAIIDHKVQREKFETLDKLEEKFDFVLTVNNPSGMLTEDFIGAIKSALKNIDHCKTLIVVDGEEDLGALIVIYYAPEGTTVIYGLPDKGLAIVAVNDNSRNEAKKALEMMEVDTDGN